MSSIRERILLAVAPRLGYAYIRLLHRTMKLEFRNREVLQRVRESSGQYILAFWHSRFVMMPYAYPDRKMVVLSSTHRDSRMLSAILGRFGVTAAWGSSTEGGTAGIRQMLRQLRRGYDAGFTPDGPRGPRRHAKPGVIAAARLSGLPIVPVAYSAKPARRLGSWDRTLVPYPFSRGLFLYGEPIAVPRGADDDGQERARVALQTELDRLTDLADRETGLECEPAGDGGT